jgi:hypothetical protein
VGDSRDREVNRVRRASTGASVNAAKNRDSAEREGNRSRSRPGHERDGKRLEPLVELFQRAFSEDFVALRAPPENRSPRTRPKRLRAKRTCSFIRLRTPCVRRYLLITTISPRPRRGREVGLRSCLDFYRTIDDTGHIRTSLLRMVGIFLIKEAYFYVDWLRVIPRCSSGGMSESEQGPRSLVRFHRGELVAGVIIAGDASIRRLSSSPVFHHETLARA